MANDSVLLDAKLSDDARRERLYAGQLFIYSPTPNSKALVEFGRELIDEAFRLPSGPLDPERAQYELPVEQFAALLGELKPRFIHHPESKRLLRGLLDDLGCDPEKTYFDVPRLRSSTSDSYLTTGIAYAWHPHRDTWYSAPPCQLNFWTPVYPMESENAMAFHPRYWNRGVANNSKGYNYYLWNQQHRGGHVTQYVKEDPRPLPKATEPMDLDPQLRLVVPPGAVILFSGAQMHSSVPNTSGKTRYSIDFRTVHAGDAAARRGAPRSDEECTGTTMRDYLRASDLTAIPEEIIALYNDGSEAEGALRYAPPPA
jgi:Phytanoyl-CoA dioxygenase (PhyH)